MKINILWIAAYVLFYMQNAIARTNIIVFGVEQSSGSSILALVRLPQEPFEGSHRLEELSYTIISRGIALPSQGNNKTVLYWKGDQLWRYGNGSYRVLLQDGIVGKIVEPYRAQTGIDISIPLAIGPSPFESIKATRIHYPSGPFYSEEISLMASAEDYQNLPVDWINPERLITIESASDSIGRLQRSKFMVQSIQKNL